MIVVYPIGVREMREMTALIVAATFVASASAIYWLGRLLGRK